MMMTMIAKMMIMIIRDDLPISGTLEKLTYMAMMAMVAMMAKMICRMMIC